MQGWSKGIEDWVANQTIPLHRWSLVVWADSSNLTHTLDLTGSGGVKRFVLKLGKKKEGSSPLSPTSPNVPSLPPPNVIIIPGHIVRDTILQLRKRKAPTQLGSAKKRVKLNDYDDADFMTPQKISYTPHDYDESGEKKKHYLALRKATASMLKKFIKYVILCLHSLIYTELINSLTSMNQ